MTSVPIDQADERIASLAVGEPLDFKAFNTPVALLHRNKVIESSLPGVAIDELDEALRRCPSRSDCEVTLRSGTVLSAAANVDLDDSYSFRSLVNLNVAVAPLHSDNPASLFDRWHAGFSCCRFVHLRFIAHRRRPDRKCYRAPARKRKDRHTEQLRCNGHSGA